MKLEKITPPSRQQLKQASGVAKVAAANWQNYCRACRSRYRAVSKVLNRIWGEEFSGKKVLDWGCAVGGVAIIMDDELPVSVVAADVDRHSIAWLSEANDNIETAVLTPGEPLPFEDNTFDAIYGISVLTHIPPDFQPYYLGELKRVVKPNGVVILTVKSYKAVDRARNENLDPSLHPHTYEQLDAAGIIYASYPEKVLQKMDFTKHGDYGITYHSTAYIDREFGKFFTLDKEDPQAIAQQDVIVMRP
jgi:ubiquinone/menaquinone biosynthesis C-methylase UbiE